MSVAVGRPADRDAPAPRNQANRSGRSEKVSMRRLGRMVGNGVIVRQVTIVVWVETTKRKGDGRRCFADHVGVAPIELGGSAIEVGVRAGWCGAKVRVRRERTIGSASGGGRHALAFSEADAGVEGGEDQVRDEHANDGEEAQEHDDGAGQVHVFGEQGAEQQRADGGQAQHQGGDGVARDDRRQHHLVGRNQYRIPVDASKA